MQSYLNIEPPYQNNYESDRNKIISHGVDTTLFYKETTNIRNTVRKHYNINDTDILLMNIGAMTKNKGIMYILQIMNILVNKLNKKHFKLLLKGTSDLYQTKLFLESYFEELQTSNIITKQEMTYLLDEIVSIDGDQGKADEKISKFLKIKYGVTYAVKLDNFCKRVCTSVSTIAYIIIEKSSYRYRIGVTN